MYNLKNLNPIEFEDLCRDIAERMFNKKVRTFAEGKDGGIDIADDAFDLILQCKHIENYNNLKTALKKDAQNLSGKTIKEYYIFTSCSLTPGNIKEIIALFDFLPSFTGEHVISAKDLNVFLLKQENLDIVQRNHKLWYCSSNLMKLLSDNNVFLDSDILIEKIKSKSAMYVETTLYNKSLNLLKENNSLLIVGNPGVGKSILSEMIVLFYAQNGYKVRYTSSNEIVHLKNSLLSNGKEIILLDDFLGSNELELSNEKVRQTESLIAYINNQFEKKINFK